MSSNRMRLRWMLQTGRESSRVRDDQVPTRKR
jgi:hypothetical protein